jgi:hypothetical protein
MHWVDSYYQLNVAAELSQQLHILTIEGMARDFATVWVVLDIVVYDSGR